MTTTERKVKSRIDWDIWQFAPIWVLIIVMSIFIALNRPSGPTFEFQGVSQWSETFKPGGVELPGDYHYDHYYSQDVDVSYWLQDDDRLRMMALAFPAPAVNGYAYCVLETSRVAASIGNWVSDFERDLKGNTSELVVIIDEREGKVATCAQPLTKKELGFY